MDIVDEILGGIEPHKIGHLSAIKRYAPNLFSRLSLFTKGNVTQAKYLTQFLEKKGFISFNGKTKISLKPDYCTIEHGGVFFQEMKIKEIFIELGIYDAEGKETTRG